MITCLAPAKINLYLHITGRRDDGYHLLDSLFVFTAFGDQLSVTVAESLSLTVSGDQAHLPQHPEDNLVYKAALLLKKKYDITQGAQLHLTKRIPIGAGLGGGSSDAATALLALNALWKLHLDIGTLCEIGLSLGADIPACLYQQPALVSGIGETIHPITPPYDSIPVLLIKPPTSLSTPSVFKQYAQDNHAFSANATDATLEKNKSDFIVALRNNKNDLEIPAIRLLPEIHALLAAIEKQPGCLLSRMSGSGPTCFGLFDDKMAMEKAVEVLQRNFPMHWVCETEINRYKK